MRTVWVLVYADYDDWEVCGIYSTPERAKDGKRAAKMLNPQWRWDHLTISEFVIDQLTVEPVVR
jgi:hypothetical protein